MKHSKLEQLFRDNAQRGINGLRVEAAADDDAVDVYLYDAIGGWFGVEAQAFAKEISAIEASQINLRINSPGGDVFDARAIHTALLVHPAKVVAHIDGLAASSATFVAMAADEVRMAEGAFWMIHNAWALTVGNAQELRDMAELLDKVDGTIVSDYESKTNLDPALIKEWMAAETWFTSDEAEEHGFVDKIFTSESAPEDRFNLAVYSNVPAALNQPVDQFEAAHERARRRLEAYDRLAA